MKQSHSNTTLLAIITCIACISVATAWVPVIRGATTSGPPPAGPPPPPPTPQQTTVINFESGSAAQELAVSNGDIASEVTQAGSSQNDAGNFQFAAGEGTLVIAYTPHTGPSEAGILSSNEGTEGSSGTLTVPTTSPALPYYTVSFFEPILQ